MKLTIEQLQELGFNREYLSSERAWVKLLPKQSSDAFFYYDLGNENLPESSRLPILQLLSSDGGDTSTVYSPITSLEKFHELEKVLNS